MKTSDRIYFQRKDAPSVTRNKSLTGKENPLSPSKTTTTTSTASSGRTPTPSPSREQEAPLFALNEKQIGASCYVRLD